MTSHEGHTIHAAAQPGTHVAIERITFVRAGAASGRVQISAVALALMRQHVQDAPTKSEAGGVLLGRHILLGAGDIVIDSVTQPMHGDRRGRYYFHRARERHQAVIDRCWADSDGTCTYLGEWHTHPEAIPTPSLTDRATWWRKLRYDRFTEPIFFIIVGTETIHAWEGRRGQRPIALEIQRLPGISSEWSGTRSEIVNGAEEGGA